MQSQYIHRLTDDENTRMKEAVKRDLADMHDWADGDSIEKQEKLLDKLERPEIKMV